MTLDLVAFDIETTGFTVTDEVTVAGFALEMGARVFYQTGGRRIRLRAMFDSGRRTTFTCRPTSPRRNCWRRWRRLWLHALLRRMWC